MGWIRTAALGVAGLGVVTAGAALIGWNSAQALYRGPHDIAGKDLPVPWPLSDDEADALVADAVAAAEATGQPIPDDPRSLVDLDGAARAQAVARGAYLGTTLLNCVECHGADLGGTVVMDVAPVMRMAAPNITQGGLGARLTAADWDRAVRHGVGIDGRALVMPAIDYTNLADRDVSDLKAWADSMPPVDRELAPSEIRPVMAALLVTGQTQLDVQRVNHDAPRPALPPAPAADATWGGYLVQTCTGCHGAQLSGGPIPSGPPDWPPPPNLTPHESGLASWTAADFDKAVRQGQRPDGRVLHPSMPVKAFSKLEDRDIAAMYAFLRTVDARPYGGR